LIDNLIKLGGITSEIYNYPEIIDAFLPIIRNDYKIIDEYAFSMPMSCFNSNITFIYSDNDPFLDDREKVVDWKHCTNKNFSIIEVKGDHFFINTEIEFLCQLINESAE
jgi:surfactin synthase thioesterase subunit